MNINLMRENMIQKPRKVLIGKFTSDKSFCSFEHVVFRSLPIIAILGPILIDIICLLQKYFRNHCS